MGSHILKVLTVVLLTAKAETGKTSTAAELWLARFNTETSQKYLQSLDRPSEDEILYFEEEMEKKDGINTVPQDSIITTNIRDIPITDQVKQLMFNLFRDGGLFSEHGFYRFGIVSARGPARMTVSKVFANKTTLLHELRQSKTATIDSGPFSILTQLVFLPGDIRALEDWLTACIERGDEEAKKPCAPKVVINYKCCEKMPFPAMHWEFGSIDMEID